MIVGVIQNVGSAERKSVILDGEEGQFTVADALHEAGISAETGQNIFLDGATASSHTVVKNGFNIILPKRTAAGI